MSQVGYRSGRIAAPTTGLHMGQTITHTLMIFLDSLINQTCSFLGCGKKSLKLYKIPTTQTPNSIIQRLPLFFLLTDVESQS